ncbi:MAG: hypothetical protein ACPL06_00105 [Candidatus Anstonellales archaeon]
MVFTELILRWLFGSEAEEMEEEEQDALEVGKEKKEENEKKSEEKGWGTLSYHPAVLVEKTE